MTEIKEQNNKVYLYGEIVSEAQFSHEVYGEGFYKFMVKVMRPSGQADILPVTISERMMTEDIKPGGHICASGEFRSSNKLENGKSRLMLTIFVRKLLETQLDKNPNSIVLSGYICKPPVYRTTPFNREIADLLIAVNRSYNKSDYIPAVAWDENAKLVKAAEVGQKVVVQGTIQSREYVKQLSETESETRILYEVSIDKIDLEK